MSGSFVLAFLAGVFSTLSPCVLPLLPVILGTAVAESRYGPAALAAGLALSFVTIGLFFAVAGQSIGLDQSALRVFRRRAPRVDRRDAGLARALLQIRRSCGPLEQLGGYKLRRFLHRWSQRPVCTWAFARCGVEPVCGPDAWGCVGACGTGQGLGSSRADDGFLRHRRCAAVAVARAALARSHAASWRNKLLGAGQNGKVVLGVILTLIGLLVLTGLDKQIEAALVAASPEWLTELTTRY